MKTAELLEELYTRLYDHFGPRNWWPAETPFEVLVGAILTQNTNWQNVERAILRLKEAGVLSLAGLSALAKERLAELIRPAGYYNIKAERLRNFFALLNDEWDGDLKAFLAQSRDELRRQLLSVKGIGPETADSMILYAANLPVFVVDAYTARVLVRHRIMEGPLEYAEIQALFMDNLAEDACLYNEYHALIVALGKEYCKKSKPLCKDCPLSGFNGVLNLVPQP